MILQAAKRIANICFDPGSKADWEYPLRSPVYYLE